MENDRFRQQHEDEKAWLFIDQMDLAEDAAVLGVVRQEGEDETSFRDRVDWMRSKAIWDLMTGLKLIDPTSPFLRGSDIRQRFEENGYHFWAVKNGMPSGIAETEFGPCDMAVASYGEVRGGPMDFAEAFGVLRDELTRGVEAETADAEED